MLNIVSTPIGNLDDLSIRQAKTLAASDIILAEDTRSAKILINTIKERFPQLTIHNSQLTISYYKEKEFEKLPEIIDLLKQEKNISLISEAGTPLISDPGYLLVKSCVQKGLPITVISGASAATTALIYSGFNPSPPAGGYMFFGFFPKKESQILQLINRLKQIKIIFPEMVFVFYESSLRINQTLQLINQLKWNVEIVICREMTKKFEEIIRGPIDELIKRDYKGEITVVMK
jgi:16S rRNA (cytidine1402-2'-O)-methyltransferase